VQNLSKPIGKTNDGHWCLCVCRSHSAGVWSLQTSGSRVFSCGADCCIKAWDLDDLVRGCKTSVVAHAQRVSHHCILPVLQLVSFSSCMISPASFVLLVYVLYLQLFNTEFLITLCVNIVIKLSSLCTFREFTLCA